MTILFFKKDNAENEKKSYNFATTGCSQIHIAS